MLPILALVVRSLLNLSSVGEAITLPRILESRGCTESNSPGLQMWASNLGSGEGAAEVAGAAHGRVWYWEAVLGSSYVDGVVRFHGVDPSDRS